jgi:5-methylcytosine-specific restriction endonuclease McrA
MSLTNALLGFRNDFRSGILSIGRAAKIFEAARPLVRTVGPFDDLIGYGTPKPWTRGSLHALNTYRWSDRSHENRIKYSIVFRPIEADEFNRDLRSEFDDLVDARGLSYEERTLRATRFINELANRTILPKTRRPSQETRIKNGIRLRDRVLLRGPCKDCGGPGEHIHHLRYISGPEPVREAVEVLCRDCHLKTGKHLPGAYDPRIYDPRKI